MAVVIPAGLSAAVGRARYQVAKPGQIQRRGLAIQKGRNVFAYRSRWQLNVRERRNQWVGLKEARQLRVSKHPERVSQST